MSKQNKTARKDARTAGKTATKNTNTAKGAVWRTVATKRGTALRSPDGRLYYGTAQEVRDAALMPWRRKMLADGLRFIRFYAKGGKISREELAEWAKSKRRDAIQFGRMDAHDGVSIKISADIYIKLVAGSRLVRGTFDGYAEELFNNEISALLDVAESDTGKLDIPLTRHERAALDAIAAA